MSDDKVIHKIAQRDDQEIRATLNEYKGREYAHLRTYWRAPDGEWRPTKKGIAIAAEDFGELEEAVAMLKAALASNGKNAAR